jgi:hypothetical protein
MAMSLIKSTHNGKLAIAEISLPCFVLEDRRRVLSGRGFTAAIGMKGRGQGVARILSHSTLTPFMSDTLVAAIQNPVKFAGVGGRATDGYEATILGDLCEAILNARDNGALKTEQELRYGVYADSLIRAFAKVGIIALVDEATGYQDERERDELHQLLAHYLREERLAWAKRFPDEYYRQLYRLRGWEWPCGNKKTPLVGQLTNRLVYEKLPPGVMTSLKERNPTLPGTGRRRWKHHQFLSEDIGQPDLRDHLLQLIAIMRASKDWPSFQENFERVFPGDQASFDFDEE